MAWHHGTFSCGHEGRVNIVGPTKNRDWIAERKFEGKCPECYEIFLLEERTKANEVAADKAKEMELPNLTGTEKQVAWANTLRQKLIDKFEDITEENVEDIFNGNRPAAYAIKDEYGLEYAKSLLKVETIKIIEDFILNDKIEAKYFIDNREDSLIRYVLNNHKEALKTIGEKVKETIEEKTELEIKVESTVKPGDAITESIVEIEIKDKKISVKFEKNDKFREIVKSLSFKWEDYAWRRTTNKLTGSAADRVAELGNKLLNAGFPVMILDEDIRNNAVTGTYEAECNRWITLRTSGDYVGRIAIRWYEDNDSMYKIARNLPKTKWDNSSVIVKIENYKQVEEFAKMYGFKFSEGVLKAIEKYKLAIGKIEIVKPVEVIEEELTDGLQEILNSGSDILDDLKD